MLIVEVIYYAQVTQINDLLMIILPFLIIS